MKILSLTYDRYIKTLEIYFSRNNLSGMYISAMCHAGTCTNTFVRLVTYLYRLSMATQMRFMIEIQCKN